ncbi:MAG: beta-lactamase family protein [Labilithrix sp.]|nr:beta-lactamase family protein [Labilithrix sp.]
MRAVVFFFASILGCAACGEGASPPATPAPASSEAPPEPAAPSEEPNALADALDAMFAEAEAKSAFSGSVIVVDGGKVVRERSYGLADQDAARKNAPDTIFRVASVSKQFTATAILALARDGQLAVDDPVSKFLPDYPKDNLEKDGVEVTLHHLLTHTSGLPDPRATSWFRQAAWRRAIDPQEQVKAVSSSPLVSTPGSYYAYLNYNFLLAALVVEKVSGQPFEAFLRERFFGPLGMKDTGMTLPADSAARAALGYTDGVTMSDDPSFKDRDLTLAFGSGQIYSTVRDLALWDRALAGDAVLAAAQKEALFTPNMSDYAYGWIVQKKGGVTVEWHNGALSPLGFSAFIIRVPSKDRFVAYLSNMEIEKISPFEAKVTALAVK